LDELVKNGFLKDYLQESQGAQTLTAPEGDQRHEMPVHGEVHTISGGFSGGGCTTSQRKKYARVVMTVEVQEAGQALDNDPVVISVVTTGRKVHRVLVDQGS